MTYVMGDSTTAGNIPSWVDVEAGYVDGKYQSYYGLDPRKKRVSITTNGIKPADIGDIEKYDLSITDAPRILGKGSWGLYISVSRVRTLLQVVPRASFKLLTAHYGAGEHICNPSCYRGMPTWADGTQWIDHGSWDQSLLLDTFFTLSITMPVFDIKETEMFGTPAIENGRAYAFALGAGAEDRGDAYLISCDLNGTNPSFINVSNEGPANALNNGGKYVFQ